MFFKNSNKSRCIYFFHSYCSFYTFFIPTILITLSKCTAEPTLLCTLLDFADDAEADTRQATDLSDAGAKVLQLFDDAVTLLFLVMLQAGGTGTTYEFGQILTDFIITYTLFRLVVEVKDVKGLG